MVVNNRGRSIALGVTAAALAATMLINYPVTSGVSASRSILTGRGAHAAGSLDSPADALGPLSITPALDSARAASAVITADGGTLTATAASGAVFTLTLPKGALTDQQNITMTPAASIPDLPLGGGLAGGGAVQIEPQGLILMETATLVIQPASPISFDQQSPFGWVKAGEDFHLFPLSLDLTTITLNIDHVDGYGIGSGSSADRQAIAAHQPSGLQPRREQNVEIAVEGARNKLQGGLTKKQQKKLTKALNATLIDLFEADLAVIESELTPPTADNAQHQEAFSGSSLLCGLFDLLRELRDQGELAIPLSSIVVGQATTAVLTLRDQYSQDCQQNIFLVSNLISLARLTSAIAGADTRFAGLSSLVPSILDRANNCARLKLTFNSHIEAHFQYGTYSITMHSDVPLNYDAQNRMFTGQAPMVHASFSVIPAACSVVTEDMDDTCKVYLKLGNIVADCDSDTSTNKDYDVYIDIGLPEETITIICPNVPESSNTAPVWAGQFACSHISEYYTGLYRIQGWTQGSGDILASKKYEGTLCNVNPFKELTTIELRRQ